MEQFIGSDAHKKFSVFVAVNENGRAGEALRVPHDRDVYREFLARLPASSAIAVTTRVERDRAIHSIENGGIKPGNGRSLSGAYPFETRELADYRICDPSALRGYRRARMGRNHSANRSSCRR